MVGRRLYFLQHDSVGLYASHDVINNDIEENSGGGGGSGSKSCAAPRRKVLVNRTTRQRGV